MADAEAEGIGVGVEEAFEEGGFACAGGAGDDDGAVGWVGCKVRVREREVGCGGKEGRSRVPGAIVAKVRWAERRRVVGSVLGAVKQ